MLIRISLIIALLAGLGALVVSHVQVAGRIDNLTTDLTSTKATLATTQESEAKAKKEAKANKELADKTAKDLADTSEKLEAATSRGNTQQARADKAEAELKTTAGELTDAQRDLSAWKALGITVDQVQKSLEDLKKATAANDALKEEKVILIRNINRLSARLAIYEKDKEIAPDLPVGLKGKVVAVDPKWDFIVLDIGSNQGLVERGEMLVDRAGKLVAKVRVTSVEPNRAIANVLPEWKQADVMEGDEVLH